MNKKSLKILLLLSLSTPLLAGCISQNPPKQNFINSISSINSATTYEITNNFKAQFDNESILNEDNQQLIETLNNSSITLNSKIDKNQEIHETNLNITTSIGYADIGLEIPILFNNQTQKLYIDIENPLKIMNDFVLTPQNFEKTIVEFEIGTKEDRDKIQKDNKELSFDTMLWLTALNDNNFERLNLSPDDKTNKIADKIKLTLTHKDITDLLGTLSRNGHINSKNQKIIDELFSTVKIDTITITPSLDRKGNIVKCDTDIHLSKNVKDNTNKILISILTTYEEINKPVTFNMDINKKNTISSNQFLELLNKQPNKD
jgi:hypothetical protein